MSELNCEGIFEPEALVPPSSLEAEQAVICCAMIDAEALAGMDWKLSQCDFYHRGNELIWGAVMALSAAKKPIDVITVLDQLRSTGNDGEIGGVEYLRALSQSLPSASNIKRYAEIVREKAAQRRIIQAVSRAHGVAWGSGTAEEKIDAIAFQFSNVGVNRSAGAGPKRLADLFPQRLQFIEDLREGKVEAGTKTGIPALDSMLSGGIRPGMVYVLAARPSVGKSSFAQSIGLAIAECGVPALMLSQEMPSAEVVDRALANLSRVSYSRIQQAKLDDDDYSRLVEGVTSGATLPFYIDDQPALRIADIKAKARAIKGLGLLIVDYVQLCASDENRGNRNAEIEQISRGLKELAKNTNTAVLLLSQLNRKCEEEKREPVMSDLRDSGAIEQDADAVMFLWPVRDTESGHRIVGAKLEKNRQGRRGRFALHFDGDHQRWGESSEPLFNQEPKQPRRRVE